MGHSACSSYRAMPLSPLRPCPGRCGALTRGGRCPQCASQSTQAREARRPVLSERGWYHTPRWKALRKRFLAEHPLCACGCLKPADTVDHIRPHRMDEALFFDWNNLQAMTAACHSAKTAREDGGFGNWRSA